MRQITDIKELRSLQMDLLNEVHTFCQKNNITYFLSSGTLIGAVRHKGYIPWDDDIDLYMPRRSYEQFVRQYKASSPRFQLLEPRLTKHYFYTFAKLADTRTHMVETWYQNFPIGVNIDIFPLDYVTDNSTLRCFQFKLKKNLFRIYIDKQVPLLRDRHPFGIFKRFVCKLLPLPVPLLNLWMRNIAYRHKPSATVCNMTEMGPSIKGCFSAEAVQGTVDIEFEGPLYKTMSGYAEYLTHTYGDYMTLPPVSQRQTHQFEAYYK